ncbi:hypothetical protein C8R44DRAFT_881535 [Mycena epipterygia]|nr:hypothetical protein C8R44DRAFT_881535 [Mycena epipterygia]
MAEVWSTANLSSDTEEASLALAHLRRVLPAELSENKEITSALENLESKVSRLLNTLIPPSSFHPNPAAPVRNLAEHAHKTLWDQVPLHAMANAYRLKAAELSKGDDDGSHNDKIYALYYKCLQLSPGPTDGTEYKQLKKRFTQLERVLSKGTKQYEKPVQPGLVHAVWGGVLSISNVQFSPVCYIDTPKKLTIHEETV